MPELIDQLIPDRMVISQDVFDAFGRLRTSDPITLFDNSFQYDLGGLWWETVTSGTASAAHVPATSSVTLTVGTDADDLCQRQTYQYFKYQPGKSQLILLTGVFGAAKAGVTRRMGYYDDDNGIYLEQTSAGVYLVKRSKISGSVVNTRVEQADWNIDPLMGTGINAVDLDLSKAQILLIDMEWLGVGSVRCGFVVDGKINYAHAFHHANEVTSVYMTTANLPVRYEILNATETASESTMSQICQSVISEGGVEEQRGRLHAMGNGATLTSLTTATNLISVRPKATFNSVANRVGIFPENFEIYSGANGVYYQVLWKGTLAGTTAWTSAGDNSAVEYRVDGTTVAGGEVIAAGYVPATNQARNAISDTIAAKLPLTLNKAGSTQFELNVVATSLSGTATAGAVVEVREAF